MNKQKFKEYKDYVLNKLEAAAWVAVALYLFLESDIVKVIFYSQKIQGFFKSLFLLSGGIFTMIVFYATVYLPFQNVKMREKDENTFIVLTNVSLVVSFTSCIICVFPVYQYWTLVIIPIMSMGCLMMNHFVPFGGKINTVLTYFVLISIFLYSLFKEQFNFELKFDKLIQIFIFNEMELRIFFFVQNNESSNPKIGSIIDSYFQRLINSPSKNLSRH